MQYSRPNKKSLRYDEPIREQFTIKLINPFESLYDEASSISEQGNTFIKAHKHAAEKSFLTMPKSHVPTTRQPPRYFCSAKTGGLPR